MFENKELARELGGQPGRQSNAQSEDGKEFAAEHRATVQLSWPVLVSAFAGLIVAYVVSFRIMGGV